ncbi:MAG TPA: shikimate kinase, partial [Bacteroidales bacterium]|nr:shikimate kinase [Bacteroidales bacterium]
TMIEKEEGMSVRSLFKEKGEAYFRDLESKVLRDTEGMKDVVIACGGGTPCYGDNMDFMNSAGLSIYLKLTAKALFERLHNAKVTRPLLEGMNSDEMKVYIEQKLEEREKCYLRSKMVVDALSTDPGTLLSIILYEPPYNRGRDQY